MERTDLEGFIYDLGDDIRTIYHPLLGEILTGRNTKVICKCGRPEVGKWCRFRVEHMEGGKWLARRVELMAYPRLKYVIKDCRCIVEGTAVVCNITGESGFLWNDYIGFIAVEGEIVHQLNPLTAVEFKAVPFIGKGKDPAYFMATEVTVEPDCLFQSDLMLFARNAEVRGDGLAHVPGCAVIISEKACSFRPITGTKISILYYKEYSDETTGVAVYATTDSKIVAGIGENFFTTERCIGTTHSDITDDDDDNDEFTDAQEDIGLVISQSPVSRNEVLDVSFDLPSAPSESIVEFAESDESNHSSGELGALAAENTDLSMQILGSSSSPDTSNESIPDNDFRSSTVKNEIPDNNFPTSTAKNEIPDNYFPTSTAENEIPDNDFLSKDEKEIVEETGAPCDDTEFPSSSKDFIPSLTAEDLVSADKEEEADIAVAVDDGDDNDMKSEISITSQDLYDEEFIEHLKKKMKEKKKPQEEVPASDDISGQDDESGSFVEKSGKEKLRDEMNSIRVFIEERLAAMRRMQNRDFAPLEVEEDNNLDITLRADQPSIGMDFVYVDMPEENTRVEKVPGTTWSEEVYQLCVEVLTVPGIRNFVSVNANGHAVLSEIMKFLECQMTQVEASERLGVPLNELTPESFDTAHCDQAGEICAELMRMDGFEGIAGCEIPSVPEWAEL